MMNEHGTRRRTRLPRSTSCLPTLGAFAFLAAFAGCAPTSPSDEALQSSIVITLRAPDIDFGAYRTYYLRPEIRELTTDGTGGATVAQTIADPLLDETRKQLAARGYQLVEDKSSADLGVEMIYVSSQWVSTYCYSWWDPYYWGYAGWYYYPYYNCGASTWQTNTLATMMTTLEPSRDREAMPPGTQPPQVLKGIWFGGVSGLVTSASDSIQRGIDGIDQAFAQSPYIQSRQ